MAYAYISQGSATWIYLLRELKGWKSNNRLYWNESDLLFKCEINLRKDAWWRIKGSGDLGGVSPDSEPMAVRYDVYVLELSATETVKLDFAFACACKFNATPADICKTRPI